MYGSLDYLECFSIVAETLSFSDAAKRMRISQPSVSRQIRLLEEKLRIELFARDRQHVQLTAAGIELNRSVSQYVRAIQESLRNVREQVENVSGSLAVGALIEFGQTYVADLCLQFQKRHPAVSIHLELTSNEEIFRKLKNGELTFGFTSRVTKDKILKSTSLVNERSVLVTRTENPVKFESTKEPPMVAYRDEDPLLKQFLAKVTRKSIHSFPVRMTVNSHRAMHKALLASNCFAVMPYLSIAELVDAGRLRVASGTELLNKIHLVFRDSNLVEKRNEAFRNFVTARPTRDGV